MSEEWRLIETNSPREWEVFDSRNFVGHFEATSGDDAVRLAVSYLVEEAQLHYEHGNDLSCDLHVRCKATDERVRQRVKTRVPEGMPDRELY